MILNADLVYLVGVIYGDGYIRDGVKSRNDSSKDYKIALELTDIQYLQDVILPLFQKIIITKSKVRRRKRKNKQEIGMLEIRNKQLYLYLTEELKTVKGRKPRTVDVPVQIKELPLEMQNEFIAGFFDTDGGFKNKSLGLTSKSEFLRDYFCKILKENNIEYSKDFWINKKYNQRYFAVRIKKTSIDTFLKTIKLRNPEKIARIKARYSCAGAGAVKRAGRITSRGYSGHA